ncbi:beta-amyrin synthase, partial [Trifolium pratense]
ISKGSWTFSDQDHGWQVSDCTADALKCCLLLSMLPPEIVGEKMEPERLYDAVNVLLSFQEKSKWRRHIVGASRSSKMVR